MCVGIRDISGRVHAYSEAFYHVSILTCSLSVGVEKKSHNLISYLCDV